MLDPEDGEDMRIIIIVKIIISKQEYRYLVN